MKIEIDENAGFCWGVVRTIEKVEDVLDSNPNSKISILGEIIHNPQEIKRLADKGLHTVSLDDLPKFGENEILIIRAHGEPPSTYKIIDELKIQLIDATCPLVQNLQKLAHKYYETGTQVVIFGKKEHPEVIGLRGVCDDKCIVIKSATEALEMVDFTRKTLFISQTTMDGKTFDEIEKNLIEKFKMHSSTDLLSVNKSICRFVSGREENLRKFARENQVIVFVAGKNSSNGKSLYNICLSENTNIHFIETADELEKNWFDGVESVGITGATSTPEWCLNEVKERILHLNK